MKKGLFFCLLCSVVQSFAQYPTVPFEAKRKADADKSYYNSLFAPSRKEAMKVVQEEAAKGKPYIPWASRPEDLPQADLRAFPGAEGGGAFTMGGRGGKVLTVTNLDDYGEGSLRWACEQGGSRIVVFNVAGVIHLNSSLKINAPYLTLAGQTAPGDGVCVTGATVEINTHDVIVRHMRFRRGITDVAQRDDCLGGNPVGNIIIDHCSTSWGLDENISLYRHNYNNLKLPTVNLTIQNCISSEALDTYNHGFGSTLGGENCTFLRNLWACNVSRNPSIGMGGGFNLVNCVIFNWWNRNADGGDETSRWNIINNYYIPGPVTMANPLVHNRIARIEGGRSPETKEQYGHIYAAGNIMEGNEKITADNWDGGIQTSATSDDSILLEKVRSYAPFPMAEIRIMSAGEAYDYVLLHAGATIPCRDAVDSRIITFVRTGKVPYYNRRYKTGPDYFELRALPADSYKMGIIYDIEQVGGMPEYQGKSYTDTDHDGMPDSWEIRYGLNPHNPSDAQLDCNGDGYSNIEKYINGIDPSRFVDWSLPENNIDPLLDRKSLL